MNEKILVVNDDEDIRDMIEIFLKSKGYQTLGAESGKLGIELAANNKPDLILLDIMMPEMDGYLTCEQLKANSATKDIPVIFLSSLTSPKDKVKGLELGGVDFINTIGDQAELLARVQTHLKIKTLTQKLIQSNEELIAKQKVLDENLSAAATIQRSFLLYPGLKITGIRHASMWVPANPLGGDIYNAIPSGKDKVVLYLLDVSGHDVPSALVTVSVSQFLFLQNATQNSLLSPKQILQSLDKEYPIERFNRFFTIFYIVLDIPSGKITYSCAGHPPAILLRKDHEPKKLDIGGTVIGLGESLFNEGTEQLQLGDKVILYSDGVFDRKNPRGESYGIQKLCDLLERIKNDSIESIVNAVQKDVEKFACDIPSADDVSIIGFEFTKVGV